MRNREEVLEKLKKACALATNIFTNTSAPHFAFVDKEQKQGAVVVEMKAPVQTDSIADFLHEKVVEKAMELMKDSRDLRVAREEKCTFPRWKKDLGLLAHGRKFIG